MYSVDTQLLQIVNSLFLSQSKVFTLVHQARWGVNREITMMQLIDDKVCRTLSWHTTVGLPACRVSLLHIDNGTTSTITAYGLGKDTRCFAMSDIKGIELTFEVSLHSSSPCVIATLRKFNLLVGFSTSSWLIKAKRWFVGSVKSEGCFVRRICHLVKALLCSNALWEYKSGHRSRYVIFEFHWVLGV